MYKKRYLYTLIAFFCASIIVTFFAISNSSSLNKHFNEAVSQEKEEYKFRLVGIVCSYINRFYVEPDRIKPKEMLKESLSWLERIIPEVQVNVNDKSEKIEILVDDASKVVDFSKIRRLGQLYNTLNDVLHFVNDNKHHEIKTEDIEYAAINGMLSQLDPHSVVFPPKDFTEFKIGTSGKFGGLGMVVGLRDGILTVISPIEGTPAFRAGLKSGDKIIAIDEDSTINMSLQEAVNKLRGDPSTAVILIVESKKSQTNKTVTLIREIISIPSVSSKLVDGNIGYIKIRNFQEDTSQSLDEEIEKLTTESGELKGLILDLRNNSGGLLGQAIAVADKFLSSGLIVITVEPMGKQKIQKAKKSSKDLSKCPLVVIIDAGSASGAEIVAGALKDNNRAPLIGDTSFGKGSIQQLIDLINSGAALKLTVGKYLTPNFTDIQSVGIAPDVLLVQSQVSEDEIILFNENPHFREKDLKKHLEEHSKAELPYEKVRYLVHVDDETEEGEEKEKKIKDEDYYKIPDLEKDTHVQFAKKIILNSHLFGKNDDFLDQLKPIIEDFKKREETKISDALNIQGIDWSTGETAFPPSVTTKLQLTPSKGEVKAAEELKIEISVTNNSDGTFYQLRGMTESKNLLLDKREFIFGKIEKGETKTSSKTIKIPQNSISRKDEIVVKFHEFNGNTPEDVKGTVLIDALPKPVFSYSYQIIDEGEGLTGNGDGIIQRGEVVDLVLFVKNIGKGTSEKNIIALRELSQKEVYIERGKMELGELPPGESKYLKIKLSVRDTLEADDFSVDLTIADTTYGTRISGKLEFKVDLNGENGKMQLTERALKVIDDYVPIYNGKSSSTPVISYVNSGATLIADKETQSWYRIKMPEGTFGWISSDHVEISWRAYSSEQKPPDLFLQNVPPLIKLDQQKPYDTFRQEHISLSGTVSDDNAIQYVYILVNEDKVFYKSNKDASETDKSNLSFASDIPLEDGPNVISIVTRDDQDLLSTKSFVVTQVPLQEKEKS
jgi:carboxyl-terminal processing protease